MILAEKNSTGWQPQHLSQYFAVEIQNIFERTNGKKNNFLIDRIFVMICFMYLVLNITITLQPSII